MQTTLKHSMSCLPDSDIHADVDAERRLVTLRVRHFDSQHVADFVTRVLPEQGVVAFRDDSAARSPDGLTPPSPFQLALFLGGRRHVAQVVRLASGETTVWLEDPSEDSKRQLKMAAARALQLLHDAGWMAIAVDSVASGAITPGDLAEVRIDDRELQMTDEEFAAMRDRIEAETSHLAFIYRASSYQPGTFEKMLRGPHLAWDPVKREAVLG